MELNLCSWEGPDLGRVPRSRSSARPTAARRSYPAARSPAGSD